MMMIRSNLIRNPGNHEFHSPVFLASLFEKGIFYTINLLLLMALMVISGCAERSALIKASSTSIRSDVFQELQMGGIVSPGYADLRITSSLKTRKSGFYPSERQSHGMPEFRLLINIDGQAIQIQGILHEENTESQGLREPEAGEGIRYRFEKNLRLKAATHKIVIAIPDEGIALEREITLIDGSVNSLVLEPLYGVMAGKRRIGFYGETSFMEGIKGFRVVLNGKVI